MRVRHNKQRRFLSAHIETESRLGVSIEVSPNIEAEDQDGTLTLHWTKDFPVADAKYSLHWSLATDG